MDRTKESERNNPSMSTAPATAPPSYLQLHLNDPKLDDSRLEGVLYKRLRRMFSAEFRVWLLPKKSRSRPLPPATVDINRLLDLLVEAVRDAPRLGDRARRDWAFRRVDAAKRGILLPGDKVMEKILEAAAADPLLRLPGDESQARRNAYVRLIEAYAPPRLTEVKSILLSAISEHMELRIKKVAPKEVRDSDLRVGAVALANAVFEQVIQGEWTMRRSVVVERTAIQKTDYKRTKTVRKARRRQPQR